MDVILIEKPRTVKKGKKYLHFKNNVYQVIGFSNPNPVKENLPMEVVLSFNFINVIHADGNHFRIFEHKGRLYHDSYVDKKNLVIYHRIDYPNVLYARPIKEFLSEVDRNKYPDVKQKYRFEEIVEI